MSALVYGRMVWDDHQFVQYDDQLYIFHNDEVMKGLSVDGIRWAFSPRTIVAANWHPLTVISHMLDCQLFGGEARWHHLVSLGWHTLDSMLLFLVLSRMTGTIWTSGLVAALFCWHPLHVESVAWASERKDVLSAFFWIVGLGAYAGYVARPSVFRYLLVAVALILGLLSKPMVVTLPAVLLLLDYWPLGRLRRGAATQAHRSYRWADWSYNPASLRERAVWLRLVWEKVPLFAIAGLLAAMTVYAQASQRAVASLASIPLSIRIVNVLMSYNAYIGKTLWPMTLAIPYQIDTRDFNLVQPVLGGVGLVLVTAIVFALQFERVLPGRRCAYWLVGLLWYIGTLVPVIGLVQVGSQAMADRYSYIPLIGIFIGVAFTLRDLVLWRPRLRVVVAGGSALWLLALALVAYRQVGYWKDTITLFSHSIESTKRNYSAYVGRATGYMLRDQYDKALADLNQALKIAPDNGVARCNRGVLLEKRGDREGAIREYELAATKGDFEPGRMFAACARVCLDLKKPDQARAYLERAVAAAPDDAAILAELARLDIKEGRTSDGVRRLRQVIARRPDLSYFAVLLSRVYSLHPDAKYRNGPEALRLAQQANKVTQGRNALALDTLAAAYAEMGRFDEARRNARLARARALYDKEEDFAREIERHYESYLGDRPYREDPRNFKLAEN